MDPSGNWKGRRSSLASRVASIDLDPRIESLADALEARTVRRVERAPEHIEAAVSVVLRPRDEIEILLVRRADRERDPWSGHVGLPGGRREPGDEDLVATALRETEEETGIAVARQGTPLGFLDEVEPAGPGLPPIVVAPLVGAVPPDVTMEIDPRELADATWAPLSALRDPRARDRHVERIDDLRVAFPAIRYGEFLVWGLTYRILIGFLQIADRVEVQASQVHEGRSRRRDGRPAPMTKRDHTPGPTPPVALETAVLTTGLPHDVREAGVERMEAAVRAGGATPAWIGVLEGRVGVGLDRGALERLVGAAGKVASRDVPVAVALGASGGTTVSATIALAHRAGIEVVATGGIGGVHRGDLDVSADLAELARTPVVLVCSGAKAILDLPATLEALEALSVPVVGYGTRELPAFWSRESGLELAHAVAGPEEVAAVQRAMRSAGPPGALVVCVPPPADAALSREEAEVAIDGALADLAGADLDGPEVTPFLLERVAERTGGRALEANLALLEENARVAGEIAVEIAAEVEGDER